MGQAKLRKRLIESLSTGPLPENGLYFLLRRNGVSAALAVRRGDEEHVHAGLFCVDDWKDGLFQCLGRDFASASEFQRELSAAGAKFRPASMEDCRRRVAQGLRVRRQTQAEEPKDFSRWAFLLGKLEDAVLPGSLYLCPVCDSPLPAEMCKTILDCIGTNTSCYMVCRDCVRHRRSGTSAEAAAISHHRTMKGFQEMASFSLYLEEDASNLAMAMPGQTYREAIKLSLERDHDPTFSAALALESWIKRATESNETVTDLHVAQALKELLESLRSHTPLPENGGKEVSFVRDAAKEGLAAYAAACEDILDATSAGTHAIASIEKVLKSVENHRSLLNRRSYIKFIAKHLL